MFTKIPGSVSVPSVYHDELIAYSCAFTICVLSTVTIIHLPAQILFHKIIRTTKDRSGKRLFD